MSAGAVILGVAAVGMPAGTFSCEVAQFAAVSVDHGKAMASPINGLPADAMKFDMEFKGNSATVKWPNSPIQVDGQQVILPTGPGAGMVLRVSSGPCLFTESSCATMVNFAMQPDGSLKVLLTPTAITYDQGSKTRAPFLVLMEARCAKGALKP